MNFTGVKKGFVLVIAAVSIAAALCSCAKGGDAETSLEPAATLDETKLMNVAQAQRVVSQFSEEFKNSKMNSQNSNARSVPPPLPEFARVQNTSSEWTAAAADPQKFQADVNSKMQKLRTKVTSACSNSFFKETGTSSMPSNLQNYKFEVSGANCPIKMTQSLSGTSDVKSQRVDFTGKIVLDIVFVDQALAEEIDMKRMTINGDFLMSVTMDSKKQPQSTVWRLNVSTQGETFSVGAYSISTGFNLSANMNSSSSSSQTSIKDITFEISHKMMVGSDLGTIYGKMISPDGRTISTKIYKVNGVDVTEEKFTQVVSLITLPGISTSTSQTSINQAPIPTPDVRMNYFSNLRM